MHSRVLFATVSTFVVTTNVVYHPCFSQDTGRARILSGYEATKSAFLPAVEAWQKTGDAKGMPADARVLRFKNPPKQLLPTMAVKVWGELTGDRKGQFVNLAKYNWKPGQSFHLWIESAVPIQLGMFQIDERKPGGELKQISPDPRHPETFRTIIPGKAWKSPRLVLDPNPRREVISFVFVRADAGCLPINGAPYTLPPHILVRVSTNIVTNANQARAESIANATAIGLDAAGNSGKDLRTATASSLRELTKVVYSKTKGYPDSATRAMMKMEYAEAGTQAVGDNKEDVSVVHIGYGGVGHIQLVFKKEID